MLAAEFWTCVDRSAGPDGCWPWKLYKDKHGNGRVCFEGKYGRLAHRVAWFLTYGEYPSKFACRANECIRPDCCNPAHRHEGVAIDTRHRERFITACPYGHAYTKDNARLIKGRRYCRACERRRARDAAGRAQACQ